MRDKFTWNPTLMSEEEISALNREISAEFSANEDIKFYIDPFTVARLVYVVEPVKSDLKAKFEPTIIKYGFNPCKGLNRFLVPVTCKNLAQVKALFTEIGLAAAESVRTLHTDQEISDAVDDIFGCGGAGAPAPGR